MADSKFVLNLTDLELEELKELLETKSCVLLSKEEGEEYSSVDVVLVNEDKVEYEGQYRKILYVSEGELPLKLVRDANVGCIHPGILNTEVGKDIILRFVSENSSIHADKAYKESLKQVHSFKLLNSLELGYYEDLIIRDASIKEFKTASVRKFFTSLATYMEYLEEKKIVSFPFEVDYGFSMDVMVIQMSVSSDIFFKEYILDSFSSESYQHPFRSLLRSCYSFSEIFEIYHLKESSTVVFTGAWSKGVFEQKDEIHNLLIHEIESFSNFGKSEESKLISVYKDQPGNVSPNEILLEGDSTEKIDANKIRQVEHPVIVRKMVEFILKKSSDAGKDLAVGANSFSDLRNGVLDDYPFEDHFGVLSEKDRKNVLDSISDSGALGKIEETIRIGESQNVDDDYIEKIVGAIADLDFNEIASGEMSVEEEALRIANRGEDIEGFDATRVTGKFDEDDSINTVKGSAEELADDATKVSGQSFNPSGDVTRVSGSAEEDKEGNTVVKGNFDENDEASTTVSGGQELGKEDVTNISGTKEDLGDGENTVVKGRFDEDGNEVTNIAGDGPDVDKSKQIVPGEKSGDDKKGLFNVISGEGSGDDKKGEFNVKIGSGEGATSNDSANHKTIVKAHSENKDKGIFRDRSGEDLNLKKDDIIKKLKAQLSQMKNVNLKDAKENLSDLLSSELKIGKIENISSIDGAITKGHDEVISERIKGQAEAVKARLVEQRLEQQVKTRENQILRMKKIMEGMRTEISNLREKSLSQAKDLYNEKMVVKEPVEATTSGDGEDKSDYFQVKQDNQTLQNRLDLANKKVETLMSKMEQGKEESKFAGLQSTMESKEELESFKTEISSLKSQNKDLEKAGREFQIQLATKDSEVGRLQKEINDLKNSGAHLEIDSLTVEKEKLETESRTAMEQNKVLNLRVKQLDQKMKYMQVQLDKANKRGLADAGKQGAGGPKGNSANEKRLESLNRKLATSNKKSLDELADKKKEIHKLSGENTKMKHQIKELERKLVKLDKAS